MATALAKPRPAGPMAGVAWMREIAAGFSSDIPALPTRGSYNVKEAYAEQFLKPDRVATTLVVEKDGAVIGDLMLEVQDGWAQSEVAEHGKRSQAELGWTMDPAHGGQGYATEAVAELLRISFEDLGLRRVFGLCFSDNEPSWRLMERVGMRREQHNRRDSLHRTLGWLDGYGYALLAEEWRDSRS